MYVKERFALDEYAQDFLRSLVPPFGYNGFGELVFYRTYSRRKRNGGQEDWADCIIRVVEGTFSIRKDWYVKNRIQWDESFWQEYASRFARSMFLMQWLPPGRGLWAMGSDFIYERGSMALQNCGACIFGADFGSDLSWMMDALMCGVGVGFKPMRNDCLELHVPHGVEDFLIPDTREGWCEASQAIIDSYLKPGRARVRPIYDLVRSEGLPIRGFGGISSGPAPLKHFHEQLVSFLESYRATKEYDSVRLKADCGNACGQCVVAGNVRRSAELMIGSVSDPIFMDLKDYRRFPERGEFGWLSNNSVELVEDSDFEMLGEIARRVVRNGEPGYMNRQNMVFGRIGKKMRGLRKDKASLFNPCVVGETKVLTADGRGYVPIQELAEQGLDVDVFCVDGCDELCVRKMRNPRLTGEQVDVYRVTFDTGTYVDVTANHKLMLRDRSFKEALQLRAGDQLAKLNRYVPDKRSYSGVDQYSCYWYGKQFSYEHGVIAEHRFGELEDTDHIDHRDGDSCNNAPDNLLLRVQSDHLSSHADGEANANYSGWTHDELLAFGIDLARRLGRRFSTKEWQKFAPVEQFSAWRSTRFGSVCQFAWLCADLAEVRNDPVDVRTLRLLQQAQRDGYEVDLIDGHVHVLRRCEQCKLNFWIGYATREQSYCSHACHNQARDYSKNVEGQRRHFASKRESLREKQLDVYTALKMKLGRVPLRREWQDACREQSVSSEIGRTGSPFSSWYDVKARGHNHNYRVLFVQLIGKRDVYSGTVDEFHNFVVGGFEDTTLDGRRVQRGIFNLNCGEQPLEDKELCTLVETLPTMCADDRVWLQSCEYATLYASTVTLLPTHQPATNKIMSRNRRIGVGIIDYTGWKHDAGIHKVTKFLRLGYDRVRGTNRWANEEAGVPLAIRVTTMKPGGCRPKSALTTTTAGILTLGELLRDHELGMEWSDFRRGTCAVQDGVDRRIVKTFDNGLKPVFKIRCTYGMELEATADHPWFVRELYTRVGRDHHLQVQDWVKTSRLRGGHVLEIKPGKYSKKEHSRLKPLSNIDLKLHRNAQEIKQPECMSPDLAWLLGYLWGDGCMTSKWRIKFIDENWTNLNKAKRVLGEQFGLDVGIAEAYEGKQAYRLDFASQKLWLWLVHNGIYKYEEDGSLQAIPFVIRESSYEDVLAFISGLIDSDGCISAREQENVAIISIADANFADHVQHVAMAVGIVLSKSRTNSKTRIGKRPIYNMTSLSETQSSRFEVMARHSNKASLLLQRPDLPWSHERGDRECRQTFGKVLEVVAVGEKPTFDVQVDGEPWFYAGAVKSHNTVPKLAGRTSGLQHPNFHHMLRRIRIARNSPLYPLLAEAGIPHEVDVHDKYTDVFEYPILQGPAKPADQVTIWEQAMNLILVQREWSDNAVSNTLNFRPMWPLVQHVERDFEEHLAQYVGTVTACNLLWSCEVEYVVPERYRIVCSRDQEGDLVCVDIHEYDPKHEEGDIEAVLSAIAPLTKSVALLPHSAKGAYAQMPEEGITLAEYERRLAAIRPIDWSQFSGSDGVDERYCTADACTRP